MQAKGRLQCLSGRLTARGLGGSCREGCAGKGQAATLEQQRLTARGLGAAERFRGFKGLKAGKRQARMP